MSMCMFAILALVIYVPLFVCKWPGLNRKHSFRFNVLVLVYVRPYPHCSNMRMQVGVRASMYVNLQVCRCDWACVDTCVLLIIR